MIKVPNKIGFHVGPGGNPTGIGDWMRALDKAKIPFCLKSVDHYGPIFEAQELMKAAGDTAVPHVLIFRLVSNSEYDYDVPPYKDPKYIDDPEGGAELHWQKTLAKLPPEFDKKRVWLEVVNEVDKDLCDWLGRFGVRIADLAHAGGYKVSLFGWSSGEPEPTGWETPGMLACLQLCAERPQQAAVSLHEYSYVVDDIFHEAPFKIGRFQYLFAVCDKHNIPRPRVHITEWGWTLNSVPVPEKAMVDIKKVGQLYAPFPEVEGVAIWYLGPGFADIANKAQKLIKPVTDFTLANQFEIEKLSPAIEPLPEIPGWQQYPDGTEEPTMHKAIVVKLPQDMTAAEWNQAAAKAFEFRHTMTASHDDMLTVLDGGNDDSYVKFSHPERDAAAVELVEDAGYSWQPLYETAPAPEIFDIVDELPKHATLKYTTRPLDAITHLTIHHTVSPPDRSIESIAAYHVDSRGWPGIAYHYVIKADGRIFQTNYQETKSYHAGSLNAPGDENYFSLAVCLQGDFTSTPPPQAQQDAARALVAWLRDSLPAVTAVVGHRDMPGAQTACPGATWPQWLPYVAGEKKPAEPDDPGTDPGSGADPVYSGPAVTTFVSGVDQPASDWYWSSGKAVFDTSGLSPKFHAGGNNYTWWDSYKNPVFNLVRVLLDPNFAGDAQAIFNETTGNMAQFYSRGARDFELLNEPNIEGMGVRWNNGREFGTVFRSLCQLYKTAYPEIRLWFPGMSPGFGAQHAFIADAASVGTFDHIYGMCEHVYSGIIDDAQAACDEMLAEVGDFQKRWALKRPLVISEFAVNRPASGGYKADAYQRFYSALANMPGIQAAYAFTSTWYPSVDENQEGWLENSIHNHF